MQRERDPRGRNMKCRGGLRKGLPAVPTPGAAPPRRRCPQHRRLFVKAGAFRARGRPSPRRRPLETLQRERLGVAGRGSVVVSTQCARASGGLVSGAPRSSRMRSPSSTCPRGALVGQPDLGPEGELARLADVVDDRRCEQQVLVQTRVQRARLEGQGRHRDRVLQEAAEVGVVPGGCGVRRSADAGPVAEEVGEQRPKGGGGEGSMKALSSSRSRYATGMKVAGSASCAREMPRTSSCSSSRKRSTRPCTRTRSPRSKRPDSRSASRNARAGIAPVRELLQIEEPHQVRVVSRSLRVQANTPLTSSPDRIVATAGGGVGTAWSSAKARTHDVP